MSKKIYLDREELAREIEMNCPYTDGLSMDDLLDMAKEILALGYRKLPATHMEVPTEPTKAMVDAGNAYFDGTLLCAETIYRAMLSASTKETGQ